MGLFVCTLIIGVASFATAGIPDLDESTATIATTGKVLSLFCLPDGLGRALTECRAIDTASGSVEDGTITVTLLDTNGDAVPGYPFEDLWLASDGMVPCLGGSAADGNTDVDGVTTFSFALNAGGHTDVDGVDPNCYIMVSGDAIASTGSVFPLYFNSADINGDGNVTLTDVTLFATAFFSGYTYSCDFYYDGNLTLTDVTLLASGVGASCP